MGCLTFNLAGKRGFASGFTKGNQLNWHLQNDQGSLVANGVYLYVVTVRGSRSRARSRSWWS